MEKKTIKLIGIIDPKGFEMDNRVYSKGGCCPTLKHGNARVVTIRKWKRKSE